MTAIRHSLLALVAALCLIAGRKRPSGIGTPLVTGRVVPDGGDWRPGSERVFSRISAGLRGAVARQRWGPDGSLRALEHPHPNR